MCEEAELYVATVLVFRSLKTEERSCYKLRRTAQRVFFMICLEVGGLL